MPIISTTDDLSTNTSAIPINVMMSTSKSQDAQLENGKNKVENNQYCWHIRSFTANFYTVQSCPVTAAVVSSITIFIFTALLFLTIGIFIGYFAQQRKFTARSSSSPSLDKPTHTIPCTCDQPSVSAAPEYAPIHAKGTLEEHVQGFGMKKNQAYAFSAVNTNTMATGGQSQ